MSEFIIFSSIVFPILFYELTNLTFFYILSICILSFFIILAINLLSISPYRTITFRLMVENLKDKPSKLGLCYHIIEFIPFLLYGIVKLMYTRDLILPVCTILFSLLSILTSIDMYLHLKKAWGDICKSILETLANGEIK